MMLRIAGLMVLAAMVFGIVMLSVGMTNGKEVANNGQSAQLIMALALVQEQTGEDSEIWRRELEELAKRLSQAESQLREQASRPWQGELQALREQLAEAKAQMHSLEASAVSSVAEQYQIARKGVVYLTSSKGSGAGFLCDCGEGNDILTAYHVVEGSLPWSIGIQDWEGRENRAKIVAYDQERDIAVLQMESPWSALPRFPFSASEASPGERVFIVGYPLNLTQTLVAGIVGNDNPRPYCGMSSCLSGAPSWLRGAFVVNATINGGNSGGPALNERMEVLAVVTRKWEGEGLAVVVSAPTVREFLQTPADYYPGSLEVHASKAERGVVTLRIRATGTEVLILKSLTLRTSAPREVYVQGKAGIYLFSRWGKGKVIQPDMGEFVTLLPGAWFEVEVAGDPGSYEILPGDIKAMGVVSGENAESSEAVEFRLGDLG